MNSLKKPPANVPFVCNPSAYIDYKDYVIAPLADKTDKTFHKKAGEVMSKYPPLLGAYEDLRSCVERYHPETKAGVS